MPSCCKAWRRALIELPMALTERVFISFVRLTNRVPAYTNQLKPYTPPSRSRNSVGELALNLPLTVPDTLGPICSDRLKPPANSRSSVCRFSSRA
ncbi:hypothetical protein D3C85_1083330 [compost metagenome]